MGNKVRGVVQARGCIPHTSRTGGRCTCAHTANQHVRTRHRVAKSVAGFRDAQAVAFAVASTEMQREKAASVYERACGPGLMRVIVAAAGCREALSRHG